MSETPDDHILELLDSWQGAHVAVRITAGAPKQLVAVFSGRLGARSSEKQPAFFWPVSQSDPPHAEDPGIYLHPDSFDGGRVHAGSFDVELRHGAVTTNIRRLDAGAAS